MPIQSKAEQTFVERAFFLQIFDDKTGVKDACADLMRRGSEEAIARLDEGERMAFGILEGEARRAGFVFGDGASLDFVREKIFAHFIEIRGRESNFGEKIVGSASGDLLEFDALVAVHGIAGIADTEASRRSG